MGEKQDEGPSDSKIVEILNASYKKGRNPSVSTLSGGPGEGKIVDFNREDGTFTMVFKVGNDYINGKPGKRAQVQGGFASAMLDSVCANAVVAFSRIKTTVATLEQKVSFIRPVPPNTELFATAKVIKMGRTIAFLEAELRNGSDGPLLVKGSQTNSLIALPSKPKKSDYPEDTKSKL
mmetsp:Transcript_7341/g.8427  ORF Transcript_7341/g.8427 Transcript_7341/m.8427 type:complete len:178 (+) Transcript_7341:114-647(+)|eukprot:CAMPEP_0184010702 /NCGR_PEP_ID=MMETSP0954-20121128/3379_1 /TAXON_ID=627963 /ORGANISM="Aplanochytrium sp, Strain PBS07" /LENGTH=177 /DNA_ID=CAMNT_0026290359 /DNA_START=140 /DNA_END=673 /DNA_ORIENTATION=-